MTVTRVAKEGEGEGSTTMGEPETKEVDSKYIVMVTYSLRVTLLKYIVQQQRMIFLRASFC